MDGEIINALFGLFNQRIGEDFPCQVLGHAADLFQRLIDGHSADGDGRIADDPFAGVVNVAARAQVHDGIRAPADRPDHLVNLSRHIRSNRAVADIGVDLDQEVTANRHRFGFRMVDIVGDDRAATGDFVADKFGRDIIGDRRANAFAIAFIFGQPRAAQIFALRDIFHFRGDDAFTGVVHLADVHAGLCTEHLLADIGEWRDAAAAVGAKLAIVFGLYLALGDFSHVIARHDPRAADFGQANVDVDAGVTVGIRAASVIHAHRRLTGARFQMDFAHGDVQRANMDFLAAANGASGYANLSACGNVCH